MKTCWFIILLFGCFLSVISAIAQTAATAPAGPDENVLIANTNVLAQALKTKDLGLLNRTLTEDFHEVWSDGHLHAKAEILGELQEAPIQEFSPYNLRVLPVSDGVALVTYDCILKMPEGDPPNLAPRYQHLSDLWIRQGGQWRLRFRQFTPVRPID
jgi:ribonuclease HI